MCSTLTNEKQWNITVRQYISRLPFYFFPSSMSTLVFRMTCCPSDVDTCHYGTGSPRSLPAELASHAIDVQVDTDEFLTKTNYAFLNCTWNKHCSLSENRVHQKWKYVNVLFLFRYHNKYKLSSYLFVTYGSPQQMPLLTTRLLCIKSLHLPHLRLPLLAS